MRVADGSKYASPLFAKRSGKVSCVAPVRPRSSRFQSTATRDGSLLGVVEVPAQPERAAKTAMQMQCSGRMGTSV